MTLNEKMKQPPSTVVCLRRHFFPNRLGMKHSTKFVYCIRK